MLDSKKDIFSPGKLVDKKNILMLHSSSDLYGASKILLVIASFLKANNYNVIVVVSEEGPIVKELEMAQVKVMICRLGILRRKYFSPLGIINRFRVLVNAKKVLSKIVEEQNIDIIYSNTAAVLVGAFVARHFKIKHIWHIHEIIKSPILFRQFIGRVLNIYGDKIIVVSEEVRRHWSPYIETDKLITVYNGIDYTPYINSVSSIRQELKVGDNDVLIGMVGRINAWKGQEYFLQMASILVKQFSNLKFLLVGDAYPGYEYLQEQLRQRIDKDYDNGIVTYLGFRNDIPNILKGIDLFILPSTLPDPLPTVVLEAMASGATVIATNHGGAIEMVENHKTGILIPWDNPEKAVSSFAFLIDAPEKRAQMGEDGRKRVLSNFSKGRFEFRILDVLQKWEQH